MGWFANLKKRVQNTGGPPTTADPTTAVFGLCRRKWGIFFVSRGLPTVPLMQFLRNPVFSGTKRGSKRGIQKGILKGIQNCFCFQGNILIQNRVSAKLLAKIRASQVFWDQIKNRVSLRSCIP